MATNFKLTKNGTEVPVNSALCFINAKTNQPMKLWVGTAEEYSQDTNAPEEGVVYILTQN